MKLLPFLFLERRAPIGRRDRTERALSTAVILIIGATMWLLIVGVPQRGDAEPARGEVSGPAQPDDHKPQPSPCPGCDADELLSRCSSRFASDEWRMGIRVPYGVGAVPRMGVSEINRTRGSIRKSMRSFDDSIRRMNDSINKIRNIRR